ncbi:MAG: hypothetical protein J2P25_14030 [Nocardiopsaceae bacterium]|nr:hypothetical protein [Nocardiopsaceae bacterium]
MEPLIRQSLERLLPDDPDLSGVTAVGGYWNRTGDIEVDLVGADRWPGARTIGFVGSVKWRERAPFGRHDLVDLAAQRSQVPGAGDEARLIAVTRSGCEASDLDRVYGPADLIAAWR